MIVHYGSFTGAEIGQTLKEVTLDRDDLETMRQVVNGPAQEFASNVIDWLHDRDQS